MEAPLQAAQQLTQQVLLKEKLSNNCACGTHTPNWHGLPRQRCYSGNGTEYRGVVKTTVSGHSCVPWNSDLLYQELHVDSVEKAVQLGLGPYSYCRNPDNDEKPWCYIMKENTLSWEYCNITSCDTRKRTPVVPDIVETFAVVKRACGRRHKKRSFIRPRIIGGSSSLPGSHPWLAAIYIGNSFCAGSLVHPCWVVSAAHCFANSPLKSSIRIVLGQHLFNKTTDVTQTFEIEKYILHPDYSVFSPTEQDIVLIRLKKNNQRCAVKTQFVQPICLPESGMSFPDQHKCQIAGWGHRRENASNYSNVLQEALVPTVPEHKCRSYEVYGDEVNEYMFCAGYFDSKSDACQEIKEIAGYDMKHMENHMHVYNAYKMHCLVMLVYKDKSERAKGHKERSSVTLEDICGLDPGLSYEGLNHTLAIICLSQVVMLGFDNKETMYAWDVRIRYSLGEVHRFHVAVAPGTKLESGPATLHFCNDILVLVKDLPPTVMGQWKLSDLRRYGAVPNGFIFEGGTRCGFWAGVFFLSCAEGEQISFLFDCIVRGISPTKGPFGLRPVLPDPSTNPAYMEERVAHEALQLEKRLSLLSHSSRQGSGGDDRSLSSSSSDTSHSDTSVGSRLTIWPEQSSASTSQESHGLVPAKGIHFGEEKTLAEGARGTTKPPPKPLRSRQLQEIGRQSSSDSGIATGSHSSYSGSFSSYAGSLDICPGDEFGSLLSLPLNLPSDQNLCTCLHSEPQRSLGSEYQVPSPVRHIYDTPRSLLQAAAIDVQHKSSADRGSHWLWFAAPGQRGLREAVRAEGCGGRPVDAAGRQGKPSCRLTLHFSCRWSSKVNGRVISSRFSVSSLDPLNRHPGGSIVMHQSPGASSVMAASGSLKIPKGHTLQAGPKGGFGFMAPPAELGTSTGPEEPGGAVGYSTDLPVSDRPHSETTIYVNIPVSPTSKKQLHYMELELQEPSTGIRGESILNIQDSEDYPPSTSPSFSIVSKLSANDSVSVTSWGGSTKYAQIDIAATETAHKVGTQHAQCREERLQELEHKKKGSQE
ncbi:Protein Dok-7 [Chelonia mydas]|uniref:Protein Dok-7 n=1 Tax=Chelonia mydas TaxID=8469 RepID=M7BIR4_CHEMY|nr:Protein Dok-7 [Chelonia mydas]